MTTIELTDDDAKLFLEFRKHQDIFTTLCNSGIFKIKNGETILRFDNDGTLQQTETRVISYKRTKNNVLGML